jgi:hypothetical protein
MAAGYLISIVDDDNSMRDALVGLFRSLGYDARGRPTRRGCGTAPALLRGLRAISPTVAEDMESNVVEVRASVELRQGAHGLVDRCVELAGQLVAAHAAPAQIARGGRKAHDLDS